MNFEDFKPKILRSTAEMLLDRSMLRNMDLKRRQRRLEYFKPSGSIIELYF